jgi:hypothetical protein
MIAIAEDRAVVLKDRLTRRLKKEPRGLDTPCWEFQGAKDADGYGKIRVGDEIERTHRVTFMLYHGPVESGLVVRHKCDNPPCCNPGHLEIGTHTENMQDMVDRGRHKNNAILTAEDVVELRRLKLRGVSTASMAKRYGVSESTISAALGGQNWQDSLDFLESD